MKHTSLYIAHLCRITIFWLLFLHFKYFFPSFFHFFISKFMLYVNLWWLLVCDGENGKNKFNSLFFATFTLWALYMTAIRLGCPAREHTTAQQHTIVHSSPAVSSYGVLPSVFFCTVLFSILSLLRVRIFSLLILSFIYICWQIVWQFLSTMLHNMHVLLCALPIKRMKFIIHILIGIVIMCWSDLIVVIQLKFHLNECLRGCDGSSIATNQPIPRLGSCWDQMIHPLKY